MSKIGILIPLCSKNQDWKDLGDVDFFKYFIPSWLFAISRKHHYNFYIGYDENDEWFKERHEQLVKRASFGEIIVLPKKCNGNPCLAWTLLCEQAFIDGNDYFYQCGSDIIHGVLNFDDYFINQMKKFDNDAIVGGVDPNFWMERVIRDQNGILENVFTGRKHWERFGWFFPPEVKTWFSDDMITKIYMNVGRCLIATNIKYRNENRVGGHNDKSRYVPPENQPIAKEWKQIANKYTLEYLKEYL